MPDEKTPFIYGRIASELAKKGTPTPPYDIWISSIAVQTGLPLATQDRHFEEFSGLMLVVALTSEPLDLRQQLVDYIASHVRESVVAAAVPESEFFMIQTHQMEDRGMEIMYVYFVLCHLASIVVGLPEAEARLDTSAGHP